MLENWQGRKAREYMEVRRLSASSVGDVGGSPAGVVMCKALLGATAMQIHRRRGALAQGEGGFPSWPLGSQRNRDTQDARDHRSWIGIAGEEDAWTSQ